jgi:ligand-binding SRPBCC domain-containing protein
MPLIELETWINAPPEICFDLSRSIDLHQLSTAKTREKAIAGVISGLIGSDETVTWEATHLGIRQRLTSKITQFERPFHFRDAQVKGAFSYFTHDHYFTDRENGTLMRDRFEYAAPFGLFGKAFGSLYLTGYLKGFLTDRNAIIKHCAESGEWRSFLSSI